MTLKGYEALKTLEEFISQNFQGVVNVRKLNQDQLIIEISRDSHLFTQPPPARGSR